MNIERIKPTTASKGKTVAINIGAFVAVSYLVGALLHPAGLDKAIVAAFTAPLVAIAFTSQRLVQLAIAMLVVYGLSRVLRRKPPYWSLLLQGGILVALFGAGSR